MNPLPTLETPDGTPMPAFGLGTWRMGESRSARAAEVAAVRSAIELGYRLIDSAEMYGEGGAEEVVGLAMRDALRAGAVRREEICVVSKVYPHNASRSGTVQACERSLRRLGLDRIDLYLLHWRGSHPLAETVAAMQGLVAAGKIGHWGVSNFDLDDLQELSALAGGVGSDAQACAANQVYHSLGERGAEFSLLPWMRERRMPLMAYCPIDRGRLADDRTLAEIGRPRGLTAAQVALAWIASQPGVIPIPKAAAERHLRDNLVASTVSLTDDERRRIEAAFPAPKQKKPLAMT